MKCVPLFLSLLFLISNSYCDNSKRIYGVGSDHGNAILWIGTLNGSSFEPHLLQNGNNGGIGECVAVTSSHVYIAGDHNPATVDQGNATLWITPLDGSSSTEFPLPNGGLGSSIGENNAIAVNSNHVYIAGSDSSYNAALWISSLDGSNIYKIPLNGSEGNSLAITSSHVYIAGYDSSNNAVLWITNLDGSNVQERILSSGAVNDLAGANGIAVNSTHVFISGVEGPNDFLWITDLNGFNVQKSLLPNTNPEHSNPGQVTLTSNNVYIIGTNLTVDAEAGLWITNLDGSNVKTIILPNSTTGSADGIAIDASTVYIVGTDSSINAALWTTGLDGSNPTELLHTTVGNNYGAGIAIFPTTPTEPITTQLLQSIIKYSPFVPLLR